MFTDALFPRFCRASHELNSFWCFPAVVASALRGPVPIRGQPEPIPGGRAQNRPPALLHRRQPDPGQDPGSPSQQGIYSLFPPVECALSGFKCINSAHLFSM